MPTERHRRPPGEFPEAVEYPEWVRRPQVITVEGLAATGTTGVGRIFHERYGYRYLNVSAIGRGLAAAFAETGESPDDREAVDRFYERSEVSVAMDGLETRVTVGGRDRTDLLDARTGDIASELMGHPIVPGRVAEVAAGEVAEGNIVLDGRRLVQDIAPHAELQVLLISDFDERVRRRLGDRLTAGEKVTEDKIRDELDRRDWNERCAGAAKTPERGLILDTTRLTLDQSAAEVVRRYNELAPLYAAYDKLASVADHA